MGRTICDVYGMEAGKELPPEEFIVKFLKRRMVGGLELYRELHP